MLRMETEIRSYTSGKGVLYLTYGDLYMIFRETYPEIKPIDYRPNGDLIIAGKIGITIWMDNGDVLFYYPNLVRKESKGDKNG